MLGPVLSIIGLALAIPSSSVFAVLLPSCQEAAPEQYNLTNVRTAVLKVPGTPWGISYAFQKDRAFVTLTGLSVNGSVQFGNGTIGVLDTSTFPPSLIHQIPLPAAFQPFGVAAVAVAGVAQLTVSPDGSRLFVAADQGAIVLNTTDVIAGNSAAAVIGTLNGTTGTQSPGDNAIQVLVTPNSDYAIISQEHGNGTAAITNLTTPGNLDVFKLHNNSTSEGSVGIPVGYLNLGYNVASTVVSHDGHFVYVTSERYTLAGERQNVSEPCSDLKPGFISAVNLHQLETEPSTAHHNDIPAGYAPVRLILSSNGKVLWVVSRESNSLLAYDAEKLLLNASSSNTNNTTSATPEALLATVQVGTSPVNLAFARNETRILTADANRFNYPGAVSGISVVDVQAALAGKGSASVLGRIPTFTFPRGMALSADGSTMLVTQYSSGLIQAIDVDTLP